MKKIGSFDNPIVSAFMNNYDKVDFLCFFRNWVTAWSQIGQNACCFLRIKTGPALIVSYP